MENNLLHSSIFWITMRHFVMAKAMWTILGGFIHFPLPGASWVPFFLALPRHCPPGSSLAGAGGCPSLWRQRFSAHGCTGHAGAGKVQEPRGIFLLHTDSGPSGPVLVTFAESPLSREDLYSLDTEELNEGKKDFYTAL